MEVGGLHVVFPETSSEYTFLPAFTNGGVLRRSTGTSYSYSPCKERGGRGVLRPRGQGPLPPRLILPPASELDILGAPRLVTAPRIKVGVVSGEPRLLHQPNAHPRHARARHSHDMLPVGAGRGVGGRGGGRLGQERVTPLAHHRGRPPLCHCLWGEKRTPVTPRPPVYLMPPPLTPLSPRHHHHHHHHHLCNHHHHTRLLPQCFAAIPSRS
ncbi:hypothetical protein E2C01_051753 [Portunus trituberculatus]|uniref:Uncharacterized protein n=1 Tax=Portunus trituberculatus TaxID=210409 RepID=A0A5B7GKF1_PORTR|nr:hypothetical protein [Portunus trituberculatus]